MSTLSHLHRFMGVTALSVTITSPTEAQVITTASPIITWTFAPGTQLNRRVRIYRNALLTQLQHDSGILSTSSQSYTVPSGAISNSQTYYIIVDIVTTDGIPGQSDVRSFSTAFATAHNVTGVSARAIGGCNAPTVLPRLLIKWNQVTPGGGETFIRYEVWRRVPPETAWTVVATVTDVTVAAYFDATVNSREVYQYAVVYVANASGSTLYSAIQSSLAQGYIEFDHLWLHVVGSPTLALRFESHDFQETVQQDIAFQRPWNRQAPTAYIGQAEQWSASVSGLSLPVSVRSYWTKLLAIQTQQRSGNVVLCARFGRARTKRFCIMTGVSRSVNVSIQSQNIELAETHYTEAVAV